MIKNICKYAAALVLGLSAIYACDEDVPEQVIEPVFPSEVVVDNNVAPGSVLEFDVKPNLDWEISVPLESLQWFWLVKEGEDQKYDRISGKASDSPITIMVGVSPTEEFGTNRSVKVTMKMADKSQVVAEYMRPAKARTLSIYSAKVDEWGFVASETEDLYSYTEAPVESFSLLWPEEKNGFMMPVKIESNFDWNLEYPEWVEYVVSKGEYGKAGVVEMRFDGVSSKYPVAGDKGTLLIKAADDPSYSISVEVSIPACNDRIGFGLWNSVESPLTFNYKGQYNSAFQGFQDGPAGAFISATSGARIIAVEYVEAWEAYDTKEASWVTLSVDAWNTSDGADVIQERNVEISVAANDADSPRKATLFFLPENITVSLLELFNEQGTAILEQYQKYTLELTQEGKPAATGPYITLAKSNYGTIEENGGEFKVAEESWLPVMFDATPENSYKLTYSKAWTRDAGWMNFASPFTSYTIHNENGDRIPEAQLDSYWLSFMAGSDNSGGVIDMDATAKCEGFVRFIDSVGNTLAVVWCVFDPSFTATDPGQSGSVKFVGESAQYAEMVGATLTEITSGQYYDTYKEYGCPIWELKYGSYMARTFPMTVSVPGYTSAKVVPESKKKYFWSEGAEGGATVSMQCPEDVDTDSAVMLFYSGETVVFVLVCVWAPVM